MKNVKKAHKKYKFGLLLLVCVVFLCTGCSGREKEQMLHREKGINLMENGKYEKAMEEFQLALDLSLGEIGEKEVDICFYKAEAQYYLNDVEGAKETYTAIIDFNEDAKAYFLRGNLYYSLGDEGNALSDYEAAIENDKKNYELYMGVYEALTAHGKEKEALTYLNHALNMSGNTAYDKMQKGRIHFMLGEAEEAVSLLEEAIKGREKDAYFYLADVYEAMGDEAKAQENITAYVEGKDLDSYKLFQVANSEIGKGNYDMAIQCLNKALELKNVPNKQMILKSLAIAYEHNRDFETAKKLMEEYIETYPDDEEAAREYTFLETR